MLAPVRSVPSDRFTLVEERHASALGRWTLVLALPVGPLGELVEAVWASRGEGVFTQEEILPRTPTEVLFALGDEHWLRDRADPSRDRLYTRAFVSGLQRKPLAVESPADAEMAGIRLRPAGAAAFLRDSPAAIAGAVIDLDALLGAGVESLRDRLATLRDLRQRVLALAAAVERHLAGARPLAAPLRFAVDEIARRRGNVPVRALVAAAGWSHRHFATRFRAEVGVTPKAFARIARFEAAFARLQTLRRVPWADFALACGYADQAHLVRDFRELAGATPTEVFRRRAPDGLGLLDESELQARS
ncbi:MAG: helix-turn-helix domain-containing protein [Thermoanaerobaculia bacterium]|nr:helix-turn-helix domain-containing protein [Thermoanaerobaculia bacterium]